jgi:hypothetical protein
MEAQTTLDYQQTNHLVELEIILHIAEDFRISLKILKNQRFPLNKYNKFMPIPPNLERRQKKIIKKREKKLLKKIDKTLQK